MVSIAAKISMFTMFSTMALGRQLSTVETEQTFSAPNFGDILTATLESLTNEIKDLKLTQGTQDTAIGALEDKVDSL